MLVRTPEPRSKESLFGYLLRLQEANGYDNLTPILHHAGYSARVNLNCQFDIKPIATITGFKLSTFRNLEYCTESPIDQKKYKILDHSLGRSLPNRSLSFSNTRLCPKCVEEKGYIEAFYDLSLSVCCPIHHCKTISKCPSCKKPLTWKRKGLTICKCGFDLLQADIKSANEGVIDLISFVYSKLMKTTNPTNGSKLPFKQINDMTLLSLINLLSKLATFASDELPKNTDSEQQYNILKIHSKILSDWPNGYYKFLEKIGNKNKKTRGLCRQFDSFLLRLFRSKIYTEDLEFLHDEFLSFGAKHWGNATFDKKIKGYSDTKYSPRFLSITQASSMTKVMPATIRSWVKRGVLKSKTVYTEKQKNQIFKVEDLEELIRYPGERYQARTAAAKINIPTQTLKDLKEIGIYKVNNMSRYAPGYHEQDILNFKQRLLDCARPIPKSEINQTHVDMHYFLKNSMSFAPRIKANFISNYLKGSVQAYGRTGDSLKTLYFIKETASAHIKSLRNSAQHEHLTIQNTKDFLKVHSSNIPPLLENGYLEFFYTTSKDYISKSSVERFSKQYVLISCLAKMLNTSSTLLINLGKKHNIKIIEVSNKKRQKAFFILKKESNKLFKLYKSYPAMIAQRRQKDDANSNIHKLKSYVKQVNEDGRAFPVTRSGRPNKIQIALISGVNRNIFYTSPEAAVIYDNEICTNQNCSPPIERLTNFFDNVNQGILSLPINKHGNSTKELVAKECGLHRSIFYESAEALRLYEQHIILKGESYSRIEKLKQYVENTICQGKIFPQGINGKPSKQLIAKQCGFDRNFFNSSSEAANIFINQILTYTFPADQHKN